MKAQNNPGELRSVSSFPEAEIAELPDTCQEKIREFERELNKHGYWNIALVAYQIKK